MPVSATFRCTGWFSWCTLPAKNTNDTRSRGGSVRSTQCRCGEAYSSSLCSADQSALFLSVQGDLPPVRDRKSTRLNSSHSQISYAVFCLKKKKKKTDIRTNT